MADNMLHANVRTDVRGVFFEGISMSTTMGRVERMMISEKKKKKKRDEELKTGGFVLPQIQSQQLNQIRSNQASWGPDDLHWNPWRWKGNSSQIDDDIYSLFHLT